MKLNKETKANQIYLTYKLESNMARVDLGLMTKKGWIHIL